MNHIKFNDLTNEYLKYLERACSNAIDLLEEAELLHQHNKIKRAFFLLLTSFEELEKVKTLLVSPGSKDVFDHRFKYQALDQKIKFYIDGIIERHNKDVLGLSDPIIKEQKLFFKLLRDELLSSNFMRVRNALIYCDKNQIVHFNSEEDLENLKKSFVKSIPLLKTNSSQLVATIDKLIKLPVNERKQQEIEIDTNNILNIKYLFISVLMRYMESFSEGDSEIHLGELNKKILNKRTK